MQAISITIDINDSIYLRDPLKTSLGKRIIKNSILLIDDIGFEEFNFKKLAVFMNSTEASVYRYFENKYKLLTYLVAWYWDFMHFMVLLDISNVNDPKARLRQTVETLVNKLDSTATPDFIDQGRLHHVVVEHATKIYHTKKVDAHNAEGYYANYKKIVKLLAEQILAVDPTYRYPVALATSIIEQSLNNEYYLEHLPSLTDVSESKKNPRKETVATIEYMLDRLL